MSVLEWIEVYVALGGNIGESSTILRKAILEISLLDQVRDIETSKFYITSPVSEIPQNPFLNAVCRFKTTLNAEQLLEGLQEIEKRLGKVPKPKNAPRMIDLDILFFGQETHKKDFLEIPHPRWRERLFVIKPLLDLTNELLIPDVQGNHVRVNLKEMEKQCKK